MQSETGISKNLQDISDSRKTVVLHNELLIINMDIATLRGDSTGGFRGTDGEILHIILAVEGLGRAQRVRSMLCSKEQCASMTEPGSNGSERLLTLRLNTTAGPVTLISVYASTMSATTLLLI